MARKAKKAQKEVELKLEDVLWNCRDITRGKGGMAVRRDTILTLVFLKFISEKFIKQRQKLIDKGTPEMFLETPEFYQQDGAFFLPEECRWETLLTVESNKLALTIDDICARLDKEDPSLQGALPQKLFSDSKIEGKVFKSLMDEINKISESNFHDKDLVGRVYEYFLQEFSMNAEKEEGEFYTPRSVVQLIAEMIEPYDGIVYDPCCGSGGMFVQAQKFVEAHNGQVRSLSVYGQESNPETFRLAKMNLAVRGISYNLGETAASTFTNDQHKTLRAKYIMANPPFNLKKWRTEGELVSDPRWSGYEVPPISNANYAWILHMLSRLDPANGIAGFLLANGALADEDAKNIRKQLIENDKIEAIVVLPREMFYSTDISVTLWIVNQNKKARTFHGRKLRDRSNEILFVDLRTWNQNIYEKKYVQLGQDQIDSAVDIYRNWQAEGVVSGNYAKPELYRSVSKDIISKNDYSLVPSRYIEFVDRDKDIDYEKIMAETSEVAFDLLKRQQANQEALKRALKELGYGL